MAGGRAPVALLALAGSAGGQDTYERSLFRAFADLKGPSYIELIHAGSLRSGRAAEIRLPMRWLHASPLPLQRASMRVALGRRELIHRCDLRLPVSSREVLTIHDTAWLHFADAPTPSRRSLASVARAQAVIAGSAFAAGEVATAFDLTTVVVAPHGVDPAVRNAQPLPSEALGRLGITPPFVLCSSGPSARKNADAWLRAWELAGAKRHQLVMTGIGRTTVPGVAAFQHLTRADYLGVLAACDAVAVPSLYEGFGLPAIEAMAAAKPVLASNRSSLPEVCGDAAILTEPDARSLADGIHALVTDERLRSQLIEKGRVRARHFSWENSARTHLKAYERAMRGASS